MNGLNLGNVSHLGANWRRSAYVDRNNAFGVIAFDQMGVPLSPAYANGLAVNGLNQGSGFNGAYVDRADIFPAMLFDQMTNYVNGAMLNGLNGGNNNGLNVLWNGVYADECIRVPPTITYFGGVFVAAVNVPGFDTILISFDGSTPAFPSGGASSSLAYGLAPPAGTYTYDGAMTIPWNCTITAVQGHGLIGFCGNAVTNVPDLGENWSNNVVANGGASPAVATVVAVNQFGAGLNNDGLLLLSLGANPSVWALNVIAPDSLIAATTPQIYFKGSQPWANNGPYVGGDLTINGLTGNASTKFLNTGFNPATVFGSTVQGACSWYAYHTTATGYSIGNDDGTRLFGGAAKYTDGRSYAENGAVANEIGVNPSSGDGFYSNERTSSTVHKFYFATSLSAFAQIGATDTSAFTAYSSTACYVGGLNSFAFSSDTISYVSFHNGFTAAQSQAEYNRVQTLRTALGGGFR